MHKTLASRAVPRSALCLLPLRARFACPPSSVKRLPNIPLVPFSQTAKARTLPNAFCRPAPFAKRHASTAPRSTEKLERTALYELHVAHGAKMVPFAGYAMPVQYKDQGIIESHRWTREKASLFDVGHMVQHRITGPKACEFLESLTPTSLSTLGEKRSTLSCLLEPTAGGIVDDTVIARLPGGEWYMVTNAACRATDLEYLSINATRFRAEHGETSVKLEIIPNGLIALQGPFSAAILQEHAQILNSDASPDDPATTDLKIDLKAFYFGMCLPLRIKLPDIPPFPALLSRGGYTGEDGFELSLPAEHTPRLTTLLLETAGPERLRLAGLGARDTLRLEAGMCLYGHDLDSTTTPVEAGLNWIVSPAQRAAADFPGAEVILRQLRVLKEGGGGGASMRRRVGLIVKGAPAREGAAILIRREGKSEEGGEGEGEVRVVGKVTSGCPSPTLGKNIAMGYVEGGVAKAGTELLVEVRGRRYKATVVRMPFVKSRYWKQAAGTAPG